MDLPGPSHRCYVGGTPQTMEADNRRVSEDECFLFVESDSLPSHRILGVLESIFL